MYYIGKSMTVKSDIASRQQKIYRNVKTLCIHFNFYIALTILLQNSIAHSL